MAAEFISSQYAHLIANYAGILQISARIQTLESADKIEETTFSERELSITIEEWLQIADDILRGNEGSRVVLCNKGIGLFGNFAGLSIMSEFRL